ncbi:MAG: IS4 family transposase [Proteobacteria bacterium]|nr:IS4 family transposase [Pseudomonadota bacterium]MBS0464190.1 IS4 family transposase [Pseudomonadota bacterium]
MRATQVLQRCLSDALVPMHASRCAVLLKATEALLEGRRLTLMDVARSWPTAQRVRAPLKAFDRLLSNRHLQAERESLHAAMAVWLLRQPQPVIVVDWCDLKADRSQHLLRAAVAVGGRTLTLLDAVFPDGMQGSPVAEKQFLKQLAALIPAGSTPIIVTDAGFRAPWFRQVEALGWHWLGRLRHRTLIKPVTEELAEDWVPCKALYALALAAPRDLGLMHIVRNAPMVARTVLHAKPPQHRKSYTRRGQPRRSKISLQSAAREREPWLLIASPELEALSARQVIGLYARRMQIELAFRDLKSHRYGQGFEDSLTRKGSRIEILLLIHTLAAFASWLVGMACERMGIDQWLNPRRSTRRLYSVMRLGREALVRRWLDWTVEQLIGQLIKPLPALQDQLALPV